MGTRIDDKCSDEFLARLRLERIGMALLYL